MLPTLDNLQSVPPGELISTAMLVKTILKCIGILFNLTFLHCQNTKERPKFIHLTPSEKHSQTLSKIILSLHFPINI